MAAFSHNGEPGSALDRELRGLNCVRCDRLSSDLAARDAELAELMKWKAAVVNELIVAHIYSQVHDDSPRKAVHDAITWNCQVALDPLVSSDAQRLRDTYLHRAEAAERRLKLYEPIHTFDGLTIEEWKRKAEEAAREAELAEARQTEKDLRRIIERGKPVSEREKELSALCDGYIKAAENLLQRAETAERKAEEAARDAERLRQREETFRALIADGDYAANFFTIEDFRVSILGWVDEKNDIDDAIEQDAIAAKGEA